MSFPTKAVAAFKLLKSASITGAAAQNLDIDGLDINTHRLYYIVIKYKADSSYPPFTHPNIYLFINGDYVLTNYRSQRLFVQGNTYSATRDSAPIISPAILSANDTMLFVGTLAIDGGGYARLNGIEQERFTVLQLEDLISIYRINTVANVTNIRLGSDLANGLGVGTVVEIYGVV